MPVCARCKVTKYINDFHKRNDRKTQHQSECKECTRIRRSKWWKSDKGKLSSANTKLKRRFGITLEEYAIMFERQNRQCLICKASESSSGHRLAVDHCHRTGRIRGLLCKNCNVALGHFKENPMFLYKAIDYLNTYCQEQPDECVKGA